MRKPNSKMRLLPLVPATYFMVAGGPYGLEYILGDVGYGRAFLLLLLIPLVWSLPTALMVGELAAALPQEGGYYCWVRRALGPFWGFQEAWLSLAASVFDMAIYPVIFVLYLSRVAPASPLGPAPRSGSWPSSSPAPPGTCAEQSPSARDPSASSRFARPLRRPGRRRPLEGTLRSRHRPLSLTDHLRNSLTLLRAPVAAPSLAGAVSIALWNYMGWDNASTVAQEVESPQRTYPRAMLISAALVAANI